MKMKLSATSFLFVSCFLILCNVQATGANETSTPSTTTGGNVDNSTTTATSTVTGGTKTSSVTTQVTTDHGATTEKNGSVITSALPLLVNFIPMVLLYFTRF